MRKIFTFLLTLVMVLGCVQVKANNDLAGGCGYFDGGKSSRYFVCEK